MVILPYRTGKLNEIIHLAEALPTSISSSLVPGLLLWNALARGKTFRRLGRFNKYVFHFTEKMVN
jgi:hypothetical protein